MSLQNAAQHLAAQGRGPDDRLIHMSGKEVAGLQALAMAHGGSLSINPQTGLPEAGFLDNLLPTLIGAGLAYATGGTSLAMTPGMIGMGVGGLEALRTGDLGKGLMAGLGAYGGAGMFGAAEGAGMFKGADAVPTGGAVPAAPTITPDAASVMPPPSPAIPVGTSGSTGMDSFLGADGGMPSAPSPIPTPAPIPTQPALTGAMDARAAYDPTFKPPTYGGATESSLKPYSLSNLIADNKGFAAAAAAPTVMGMMQPNGAPPEADKGMIRPYTFDYNRQQVSNPIGTTRQDGQDTSERLYFQPKFTPLPPYKAAAGGLMSLAGGGPVEQMSNANAIGANTGYPMADINKAAYATPYQTPVSQNVVQGTADTGVNPMTGEQNRFAGGGITTSGNLDLHIPLDSGGGGGGQQGGGFGGGFGGGGGFGQQGGGQQSILGGGANGYSGAGSSGGQGGFGGGLGLQTLPAQPPQDPFANDDNFKNYQSQMQGMVNEFQNSDQYKNMTSLNETMQRYQQQRMGAMNPGLYGGNPAPQTYEQYLAGRSPLQQDVQATREQFENPQRRPTGPGTEQMRMAQGGMAYAGGGISTLGGYSDGGRLLKGPGDGMSDNIPAQIGSKQPARLADGEFVVPADVVSHLGNGSTDAGAKQLYKMMDRIRSQRTGKKKQAPEVNPAKAMPA